MSELDGEVKGCEVISKATTTYPYNAERYFDRDTFYPMDGVIPMVAASAAVDQGDHFDQDNFYPADGVMCDSTSNMTDVEFSDASGVFQSIKDYLSPEESKKRRDARASKKSAKTEEIKSRAALNQGLSQDKPSDVAIAEALKSTATPAATAPKGMSTTTKVLIGVGVVALIGGIAYFALRTKKAGK
jgi:hypothetical protein